MGLRCRLWGHVHDTTEFEEQKRERPDGTVLICREYKVCRRCGDREELYRNEQLLTPNETGGDTDADAPERGPETGSPVGGTEPEPSDGGTDESEADERNVGDAMPVGQGDTDDQYSTGGREDVTDEHPGDESEPQDPATPVAPGASSEERDGRARASVDGGSEIAEPSAAGAQEPEGHGATGSDYVETESGGTDTGEPESGETGSDSVTEDAVILSDSSSEPSHTGTERSVTEARTEETRTTETRTDEGVELLSFDAGEDDTDVVRCEACEREWDRNDTSLRDGDLCPECRGGYVTVE